MIIDGKTIADELLATLLPIRQRLGTIKLAIVTIRPTIATADVSVGRASAGAAAFLAAKERAAQTLKLELRRYEFDPAVGRRQLRRQLSQLVHSRLNAVILQLPLPSQLPTQYLLNAIIPAKDADCLSARSNGLFFADEPIIRPPAVEVVAELCRRHNLKLAGQRVLVIGYGRLIGKPIAHFLATTGAIVTIVPEPSQRLPILLADADIVISGAGVPGLIKTCRPGAVLIDFGCGQKDGRIVGDIEFEAVHDRAGLITPTPAGTGPILVAALMANVIKLAERQQR